MSQSTLSGLPLETSPSKSPHRITLDPQVRWERVWLWCSERINPIVVKEVRQSLKSRQFTISFGLTLVAAIAWTLLAISMLVPRIYYVPGGPPLLAGFFLILVLPMMVILPYSAFRSLTSETEESTFELLSISALSAKQIIHGKMASTCLQMVLYLSALTPCIVLTYLLRGVGLFTILFSLACTILFSVCETGIALMFAAVSRSRMLQTGMSVILLIGLLIGVFIWASFLLNFGLRTGVLAYPTSETLIVGLAILTVTLLATSLVLRAAAAAIDFPSENNSTSIRWRLFALVSLVYLWMIYLIASTTSAQVMSVILIASFVVLMLVGCLVTGERGILSPRAQRGLPATFAGRVFLSWFYPGAGVGYVFLCCLFGAIVLSCGLFELFADGSGWIDFSRVDIAEMGLLLWCYLALYLGCNRLLIMYLTRWTANRMVASAALLVVLLIVGHLVPLLAVFYFNDYREFDYAWHQTFNIFWTLVNLSQVNLSDMLPSAVLLTASGLGVFGINLMNCSRDIMLVRVAVPERLTDDGEQEEVAKPPIDPFAE